MEGPKPPSPLFAAAAWFSLAAPLLGAVTFLSASGGPPANHSREYDDLKFKGMAALCAASFLAGCVSLAGVRRSSVWAILPAAILGIMASVALTLVALLGAALSGAPGP